VRVFENGGTYSDRLNVVDQNNVLVGFDYSGQCCERFGYYFTRVLPSVVNDSEEGAPEFNHEDYFFDIGFMEDISVGEYEDGGAVAFKLVNEDGDEIYLVLYNHQNGYYSHGFNMVDKKDKVIFSGSI